MTMTTLNLPAYLLIVPMFMLCEAALLVALVGSQRQPALSWLRPYATSLLLYVTLGFVGANAALVLITMLGFQLIAGLEGQGSDLLKAIQLALILLGPWLASGAGVLFGAIVGLVMGRRLASEHLPD